MLVIDKNSWSEQFMMMLEEKWSKFEEEQR